MNECYLWLLPLAVGPWWEQHRSDVLPGGYQDDHDAEDHDNQSDGGEDHDDYGDEDEEGLELLTHTPGWELYCQVQSHLS